jgi:peptidoglycan/LPS O-acetylase OafA/YrhL
VVHVAPASGGVRGLALVAGSLVLALGAAWLLHAGVEKPAYRRLRGRSRTTLPVSVRDANAPV